MNPRFRFRTDIQYPKLQRETAPDGFRIYETPDGPAPSVTTILGTLPNPDLDAWIERVGEVEAARKRDEAARIGTAMHNRLEAYVLGNDANESTGDVDLDDQVSQLVKIIQLNGLRRLNEIWGVEVSVHLTNLYAGTTDLVGVYGRKRSIIDYKNSIMIKADYMIEKYKYQIAAYAMAHDNMFGYDSNMTIEQGVILIGVRPSEFSPVRLQTVLMNETELNMYKSKFLDIVEQTELL